MLATPGEGVGEGPKETVAGYVVVALGDGGDVVVEVAAVDIDGEIDDWSVAVLEN